jgi:hypothetical protein
MITPHGGWVSIPVPVAPNAELTVMGCWHGGCLLFGVDDGGNFAWRVHNSSVVAATAPPAADSLIAVTCFASATCGIVTSAPGGFDDFSLTTDGGSQWGHPVSLPVGPGDHVSSVSCSGPKICVVAGDSNGAGSFTTSSSDGGATWSHLTSSPQWRLISDVFCSPAACVALAQSSSSATVVTGSATGRAWTAITRQPGGSTNSLSCGTLTNCLATTESSTANPGIDRGVANRWQPLATHYLPDGVADLNCAELRCVVVDDAAVAVVGP